VVGPWKRSGFRLICHPTARAGLEEARLSGPTRRPQTAADAPQKGHGTKSAAVREQAILGLLSERRLEDAAERTGVRVGTLRRWFDGGCELSGGLRGGPARYDSTQARRDRGGPKERGGETCSGTCPQSEV